MASPLPAAQIRFDWKWAFEPTALERRMTAKQRRVFHRTGQYGRRVMRSLFRVKGKPTNRSTPAQLARRQGTGVSQPGKPPHTHHGSGRLLRRYTVYHVGQNANDLVIGPGLLAGVERLGNVPGPQLLNEGGPIKARPQHLHPFSQAELQTMNWHQLRGLVKARRILASGSRAEIEQRVLTQQESSRRGGRATMQARPFVERTQQKTIPAWLENQALINF